MSENKSAKYFKYAIGEIILVVIGILIALQINNWNENRKSQRAEDNLLKALNQEMRLNRNELENEILRMDRNLAQVKVALNTMFSKTELSPTKADSLIAACLVNPSWEQTDFALKELESSTRLSELSNQDLKPLFYDWARYNKNMDGFKEGYRESFGDLLNYLKAHGSLRTVDAEIIPELPLTVSDQRMNNRGLFQDVFFENMLDDYYINMAQLQDGYKEGLEKITAIIEATDN